jgi:hypothetical protein
MTTGEFLTRWTVRVAMALYVASLASRRRFPTSSRVAWAAGCVAYLLHVECAFAYYHHWSHAEAYEATARQTADVVGLDWGGGLYINYAFTFLWLADICWWWIDMEGYLARPRLIEWVVQGFLGFIAFNATVVFATGFSRWFGSAACVLLAVLLICRWHSVVSEKPRRLNQ